MDTKSAPPEGGSTLNEAIERISAAMTRNRLMTRRRIIARIAIAHIAPALEITHLDVLDVVRRLEGKGRATIGAVAEGMRIDPSRASRIVAELVSNDLLERRICQSDARRSILVITPRGQALVKETRAVKRSLLDTITASWEPDEVVAFSKLYDRFITGLEDYARDFNASEGRTEEDEEPAKDNA